MGRSSRDKGSGTINAGLKANMGRRNKASMPFFDRRNNDAYDASHLEFPIILQFAVAWWVRKLSVILASRVRYLLGIVKEAVHISAGKE